MIKKAQVQFYKPNMEMKESLERRKDLWQIDSLIATIIVLISSNAAIIF